MTDASLYTVDEFTSLLASDAPAPGGGSAAALAGSLGASLTSMVLALTEGKKKYAEFEALTKESRAHALKLRSEFFTAMNDDITIFSGLRKCFSLPKDTDEEKAFRTAEIQKGLKACAEPPMRIMELSLEALKLTKEQIGKTNAGAVSDLGVAALMLASAVRSAWLNVLINIGSLKDTDAAEAFRVKGEAIIAEAMPLSEAIYEEVKAAL